MPKKATAKKKVVKKPIKKPVTKRGVKHPHFQQMMVDEKNKMNEMLKTMLARGPGPGAGTTVLGAGHNEAERKLQDKINEVHNLQLQYNRGKKEIESWIRKEKDMKQ